MKVVNKNMTTSCNIFIEDAEWECGMVAEIHGIMIVGVGMHASCVMDVKVVGPLHSEEDSLATMLEQSESPVCESFLVNVTTAIFQLVFVVPKDSHLSWVLPRL